MAQSDNDILARAFPRLSALRKNIDQITIFYGVPEGYAHEFHSILENLSGIGMDVSEFRIPDSWIKRGTGAASVSNVTGEPTSNVTYTDGKYVAKPFMLTQIDAILSYFEITMSEKPQSIGFRTPNTQIK